MKSFKKSLVFLTVFAMLVSAIAPAFAATASDVVGTDYEGAVVKLGTLGVLAGYPDGTFKPENSITRAEFAKIACYVVGVQNAADLSKGATKFTDVAATNWASGYINIASERGMIKGYPDGTFKPEANVSYAEAITILVRALGMGPVVEGKGSWPANYLAKASAAGLTEDILGMDGAAKATRGNVAKLAWNTLTAEKWGEIEYTTDGIVYGPTGKTLIAEQYKDYAFKDNDGKWIAKEFENVRVIGTQIAGTECDADEIKLDLSEDDELDELLDSDAVVEVTAKDVDLNNLFGMKVDLLFGKDNKVVSIMPRSEDVVKGFITNVTSTASDKKIELDDSKEYSFATEPVVSVNTVTYAAGSAMALTTARLNALKQDIGDSKALATIVLDSGKIKYLTVAVADAINMDPNDAADKDNDGVIESGESADDYAGTTEQAVISEITSKGEVRDSEDVKIFDIDDVTEDADEVVIVKNGNAATKEDIKVGDVVTYIQRADGLNYIALSDAKVTGEVTKVTTDKNGVGGQDRRKLTIDGKVYEMVNDGTATVATTGDIEDLKLIASAETYKDYYNKEATLYLNGIGRVAAIVGSVKASAALQVGVVAKAVKEGNPDSNNDTSYYVTILNAEGVKKTYTLNGEHYNLVNDSTVSSAAELSDGNDEQDVDDAPSAIDIGSLVVYDVAADGTIDSENFYLVTDPDGVNDEAEDLYILPVTGFTGDNDTDHVNNDNKTVKVGSTTYYANADTKIVNAVYDEAVVESISNWSSIVDDDDNLLANAKLVYDGRIIKAIITAIADGNNNDELELLGDDEARYAIFKEIDTSEDDDRITLLEDGTEETYVVSNNVYDDFEEGDLVRFTLNGDGEFVGDDVTAVTSDLATVDNGCLADVSELADIDDEDEKAYEIDKIDGDIIEFKDNMDRDDVIGAQRNDDSDSVKLASDVKVYDVRDGQVEVVSTSDLAKGQFVFVADRDTDDDVYGVVVIFK